MTSTLEINGKKLHPIKDAISSVSYSRDYITRLAREKKIVATNIGRQWFIDLDSLKSYSEISKLESEIRKKQLSEERRNELEIREAVEKSRSKLSAREEVLHKKSVIFASLVLCFGLMSGFTFDYLFNLANPSYTQSATTPVAVHTNRSVTLSSDEVVKLSEESDLNLDGAHTASFSPEIKSLTISNEGMLLLPNKNVDGDGFSEMFSDEVVFETLSSGERVAYLVDENGVRSDRSIPFVVVPVANSETYEN
ncbi:hypothetical protein KC926_03610 [Candidatus Kaiserbacteria bacterium]|nr:hypothetical protein [Candidatus Kaiserbacteria bacterium]